MLPGTFTIIARDPDTGQLGVAVQSKFLAVGAAVPWARASAGAVATQAYSNPSYGPRGLELLAEGHTPSEALKILIASDDERNIRQVGILAASGTVAAHTGKHCFPWAGHVIGEGFGCLGNVLAGPSVLQAMAEAFENGQGDLAGRLLDALNAGQAAGGDWRGQESAALLVVKPDGDYKGLTDRYIDLRVDHHEQPIEELRRLLYLHSQRFRWREAETLKITDDVAMIIQVALRVLGETELSMTRRWDGQTEAALRRFCAGRGLSSSELDSARIAVTTFEALRREYALAP